MATIIQFWAPIWQLLISSLVPNRSCDKQFNSGNFFAFPQTRNQNVATDTDSTTELLISLSYNWLTLIQVVWKYNFPSAMSFSYLWRICSHDITIYATRLLLFWIKVAFAYVQIAVLGVQKTQQTLLDFFDLQQYQQVIYVSNEFFFTW